MSLLDLIRIAEPCTADWASMTGDDRARHCSRCDKTVFDLSVLTRAEAEALLAERGANLCGRYFETTDGTIVLADCLIRRKRRRLATAGGVLAAAALAGAVLAGGGAPEPVALDDLALPDEGVAIPSRESETAPDLDEEQDARARALEELRQVIDRGELKFHGEMMGGAISLDPDRIVEPLSDETPLVTGATVRP